MSHVISVPLDFKHVFDVDAPDDYIKFISKYSKSQLIRALTFLNKQSDDYFKELIRGEKKSHANFLSKFELRSDIYTHVLKLLTNKFVPLVICCRESILFGIEEVLNSNIEEYSGVYLQCLEFRYNLFRYLLCINERYYKNKLSNNFDLEDFNAATLPANSILEIDSLRCLIKGYNLALYLRDHEVMSEFYTAYIESYYGVSVEKFIAFFIRYSFALGVIESAPGTSDEILLNNISNSKLVNSDYRTLKAVKLAPIYKLPDNKFIVIDTSYFVSKFYFQFINDFWFNYIKPGGFMDIKKYRSVFGTFFENYCSSLLMEVFSYLKYPPPKSLDKLKYDNGSKEFIDFYARLNKKVFLGEFKLGSINENDMFSGDVKGLYGRKGRDEFFKCLYQLKDAILNLNIAKLEFDNKLPVDKRITIYPVCVFNESSFKLTTMKVVFSEKWKSLIEDISTHHEIKPLIILHIEELEDLGRLKSDKEKRNIWKVLNSYCQSKKGSRTYEFSSIYNLQVGINTQTSKELQILLDNYQK